MPNRLTALIAELRALLVQPNKWLAKDVILAKLPELLALIEPLVEDAERWRKAERCAESDSEFARACQVVIGNESFL